jgi:transposase
LFDNAGAIIAKREAYGEGLHRWHPGVQMLADAYGFRPKVCRPYRAKTKGKAERSNGYLKGSFVTPLAAIQERRPCTGRIERQCPYRTLAR